MIYYIFDGSYQGMLCCVFEAFERKEFSVIPTAESASINDLFAQSRDISTNLEKSSRIILALNKKVGTEGSQMFYHYFLADEQTAWVGIFKLLTQIFQTNDIDLRNFGNPEVLALHQTIKKVSRERHRMKAFIRFVKSNDNLYLAIIDPDFNVLPLITNFFKKRFADQNWLIYDIKRQYGFYYHDNLVEEVITSDRKSVSNIYEMEIELDARELEFQNLWKTYFKSTNIESRKNIKLHLRHVPKRYWKYLIEKN